MSNIVRVEYLDRYNKLYNSRPKVVDFVSRKGKAAIVKTLKTILVDAIPSGGFGDVVMQACFSWHSATTCISEYAPSGLSVIAFPKQSGVERYILNEQEQFFSNVHMNPDPLFIEEISRGIHLSEVRTDNFIGVSTKDNCPNRVNGLVLFKQDPISNPELYPAFKDFLEYDFRRNTRFPGD